VKDFFASSLRRLVPQASQGLCDILDVAHGPVEPPIRSEIFGQQRFVQHGHSLGEVHRAAQASSGAATFFPRLRSNMRTLRDAHRYIGVQAATGYDISPAAEWLLDNFHLIEAQLEEIHEGLPRRYFRSLPVLLDEPLAGLPRVYGVAWAFVAHTDGAFDEDLLVHFLGAYQETRELGLSEMWALPTTLRVVLVENLRRLAERVATQKAAREVANLCCDQIETGTVAGFAELLALLDRRGVGHVFLAQMTQRLRDHRLNADHRIHEWLHDALPDPAALQTQRNADQAADNLSVSNAVGALRAIGDADWPDIVARTNRLMQLMLTSPVFEAEQVASRDQTLHAIESLARRSHRSESEVGRVLLAHMASADAVTNPVAGVAAHWLQGSGRPALAAALGFDDRVSTTWRVLGRRLAFPVYLAVLIAGLIALVFWLVPDLRAMARGRQGGDWLLLLTAALMLFPASEAVVAVVNRLISESARPHHLPRLALLDGIPREHRVIVVIPGMLTGAASMQELSHRLLLHYLANPEPEAQFALLTDWGDADAATLPGDADLLVDAEREIRALGARFPRAPGDADAPPRFLLLHRARTFSETEQRWIGWERKRGKLEQLVAALAEGLPGPFIDLGEISRLATDTRYIVTLDSDTQLPPGRLRELVGVAAHPHNAPRLGPDGRSVVGGHGILQPRVVTPLPAPGDVTLYHWLFAGQCGIDPYSAAVSEVYQDLFAEGTFTGKGLLHVDAMHAVLGGRLPDGQVLSHDLLEGSIARCGAVNDITVIESAPFHADVAASRVHRWTRGDWQLLPFLRQPARYGLRGIHRWKMLDNLRRSLVAPMSAALLVVAIAGEAVSPWRALALVVAAFSAGPLMGALAGFLPGREALARRHFYRRAFGELLVAAAGGLWQLAGLLQQAGAGVDAIARALYRQWVSHRLLLQWTTAAEAQAAAGTSFLAVLRRHWMQPFIATALLVALFVSGTSYPFLALLLCLLWAASPVWTWLVSRPCLDCAEVIVPDADRQVLEGIARDTWRFFERCIGPADNHLPPDNLQTLPQDMVAHRTSPTNIGLYLLSAACARQFGWIGTQDLLARLEATLATLASMERYRGHFLNWYDTSTRAPLLPMYVSTVDSGNLSGHLLAVAQACRRLAETADDDGAMRGAIAMSRERLLVTHAGWLALLPGLSADAALVRLVELGDPLTEGAREAVAFGLLLDAAQEDLAALPDTDAAIAFMTPPTPHDEVRWLLADLVTTVSSAWRDVQVGAAGVHGATDGVPGGVTEADVTVLRLAAIAHDCERIAWEADFGFLYHRKRHLFHIGFRVAEQQLDAGFYDLLASESRLTSLLAIAKGDVPVSHWASLGRPFYASGTDTGLRSWSGSMFEYLMPGLVLAEPHGSVLHEACRTAVCEQMAFASAQDVPWGISESAHAGRDHTLAYQYAPQGVPRLGLRRAPRDELVIAPYATALATPLVLDSAIANFGVLEVLGARARYGFVEALDYTPSRQAAGEPFTPVGTFMSHHQGMSIVALANVLLGGVAQRWGMSNPHIEAVASLLHERAPHAVSTLYSPNVEPPPRAMRRRAPGLLRDVVPGRDAVELTHLLSNGRYSVTLRSNGAGWSRWGRSGITRWRDDALRDAHGTFVYLRRAGEDEQFSITQHPAPDPAADYQAVFHTDRVCFDAFWHDLQARTTVWVSPEDDIEFRQVELRNPTDRVVDVELISTFEPTLTDAAADEAHPAFTNLFLNARWRASHEALVFVRAPRLATEQALHAAHFLAGSDPQVTGIRIQVDRTRWLGRNREADRPLAALVSPPEDDGGVLDTGLDPVCALAVRLRIAPFGKAQIIFATAASDNGGILSAVIDKYRQPSHVQRASLMSATLTGIRLRALRVTADNFAAIQSLTTAMVLCLTRPDAGAARAAPVAAGWCDRRLLWRHGISGDRPIILVTVGTLQGMGLLRSLTQALCQWSWGGVGCDLVVLNSEPQSYEMALQRELAGLRDRHAVDSAGRVGPPATAIHMLRAADLPGDEFATLRALARVQFDADGRPLTHHVREWLDRHERARSAREAISRARVGVGPPAPRGVVEPSSGVFAEPSGEFRFDVHASLRPLRPWINVLSNPHFGAQVSETGAGYSWAVNSRMNQLTAWSNDPVTDPPAEWFLLQDLRTREVWSVAPSAWGDGRVSHRVSHGQGYTVIQHRRGDLEVTASWCVDAETAVKQVHLRLVNRGPRTQHLRVVGIAEWLMGANRADRNTVSTAHDLVPLPAQPVTEVEPRFSNGHAMTTLFATQRERTGGFGGGTAFLAVAGDPGQVGDEDWTCDRRECLDARGRLVLPDQFGQRAGVGLDPCAALSIRVVIGAGEVAERVFLLGYAPDAEAARGLAERAAGTAPANRVAEVRGLWNRLLGATIVKTPDPLFDAMVNRWLLYQSVACRMWAKAGFYQAGGATGFRDQLQDAMALAWAAPAMLRAQIVLCASRQFPEGDVQHWWHAPGGAGVRTHFSDDLLWLPHACLHYVTTTGDATLLDAHVSFIEGAAIPEGAEDAYYAPRTSDENATVFEHAARAIDRSLRTGSHGLPLMGTGDWNDGMNRVGHEGRGESVWLGWFLCSVVAGFAPLARARGDIARADRWTQAAEGWKAALLGAGWDGRWFRRAFFDDGQVLGSHENAEARIDLIAQAWAVLSKVAPADRQRMAMAAVEDHLVDHDAGLIRLLDPPLAESVPSAGYIQAYPPGVRENGGQYSHAGAWAVMARAGHATSLPGAHEAADGAYRYFTYLSPAHRAQHPTHGAAYAIEPYVMAGDVYTQPPYVGRGGWSWYTGAAAWMHRAAIESILGLRQEAQTLCFVPCLPSHWPRAELTLVRAGRTMHFILLRASRADALARAGRPDAKLLSPGEALHWSGLLPDTCFVIPIESTDVK